MPETKQDDWMFVLKTVDERSAALTTLALQRLVRERMPATPENYALWYTYYHGNEPDLNRAIDEILRQGLPLTPLHCEDLIKRFFRFDTEAHAVRSAGDQTQTTIGKLKAAIDSVSVRGTRFQGAIDDLQQALEGAAAPDTLRAVVSTVLVESGSAVADQKALRAELEAASRELATLRTRLDTVRRAAETDSLTGLANRRAFNEAIKEAVKTAGTAGAPLSLLLADLDQFRAFNEAHGRQMGDNVLKVVARLIANTVESLGTAARFGSDQFGVILPSRALADAVKIAETIRETLASRQFATRDGRTKLGTVTISIGVVQHSHSESLGKVLDRVDDAVQTAKQNGRNQVCVAAGPA